MRVAGSPPAALGDITPWKLTTMVSPGTGGKESQSWVRGRSCLGQGGQERCLGVGAQGGAVGRVPAET